MEVEVLPDGNAMMEVLPITAAVPIMVVERDDGVLSYGRKRKNRTFKKTIRFTLRKVVCKNYLEYY